MKVFSTLTSRLVLTAVALVALVCVLIGTVTAVAMHRQLMQRLDNDVHDMVGDRGPASPRPDVRNRGPGSLVAFVQSGAGGVRLGQIVGRSPGTVDALPARALSRVNGVPKDGEPHTVDISGKGSYRVIAQSVTVLSAGQQVSGTEVTGLPTSEVDSTIRNLIWWECALTLLGVAVAAGLGTYVVRRQLRPLRQVAATAQGVTDQELATGDITIGDRVEGRYTDTHNEVGQVGAALNTLLDHVDEALSVRHRSEQQARQFVADASHELRTPLSTIHGYAELSRRTPDDAGALTDAMGKVEIAAGRMSSLVEDLLLLARLDAGRPLERADVDLTHLLLEAVADARVVAPEHHWRLDLPDEPVVVPGDEQRLHQVVANLLGNGRSHTPPGTTVTVGVHGAGPAAAVTVHDNGPGMPPGLVDSAFERFTRGDSSRTRASGGAGLGLSLVNAIAVAHHGTVSVRSVPGDTTFTVSLPASET